MGERVSDEELERALAELAQQDAEVTDEPEADEQSRANLRRWIESMRRALHTDGKPERP